MNERLKAARKALGLNQTEFAARIGVTNPAISKLEKGDRNFTDQMILAICKEYGISETWLRTGDGEMFIVSEGALIRQLSEHYHLDALDRKLLEIYLKLPAAQRATLKGFALKLAEAAAALGAGLNMEATDELTLATGTDKETQIDDWNKGLTRAEAHALIDARYDAAKKDARLSTTYGKGGRV
ncbi:MAG: helix-turn-helix domain-containing protein [Acidobacteriota bacterium]|jgi:transcriptional regulator with XRE-family HTH domain|nr:helix-turn-helix domain-containing protein [Acidobacteriota bacterium]